MSDLSISYCLNAPGVVCDVVDEEVVIVHLETGVYYSTDKAGFNAWQLIAAGHPVDAVIAGVTASYEGDADDIAKQVSDLVKVLSDEGLIVPRNDTSPAAEVAAPNTKSPFEGIELHKFRDMEDLLLLDPVHEVSDEGWPHKDLEASS